jgi:4-hydroxybenzoyl-CoA thioesterase
MTAQRFVRRERIRFAHCDPAGIVFYPQFFVLFNGLVEDWVGEALGVPFATLIGERRIGLPTVGLQCDFKAVCRMGDELELALSVTRVGRSSIGLQFEGKVGGTPCVAATSTLVTTDLDTHRPIPVPDDLRRALQAFQNP